VNTDLRYFQWIVPCGLSDKGVTSLSRLLGHEVDMTVVAGRVIQHFSAVFGLEMKRQSSVISFQSSVAEARVQDRELRTEA